MADERLIPDPVHELEVQHPDRTGLTRPIGNGRVLDCSGLQGS